MGLIVRIAHISIMNIPITKTNVSFAGQQVISLDVLVIPIKFNDMEVERINVVGVVQLLMGQTEVL